MSRISMPGEVVVPSTTKVALGLEELMVKLPAGVRLMMVAPVEVLMLKMLLAPAMPWMVKATSVLVALTPATAPLSARMPAAVVEGPVALTTKPLVRLPDSLLLKVPQSVAWSWPVLTREAKGRLRVRELLEVEMLKMLPAVPVETLPIILLTTIPELEERFLEASVTTREEAVRVETFTFPKGVTWKKEAPDVEATAKIGKVWAEVEATT